MKLPSAVNFIDEKTKKIFSQLENGDTSERELHRAILEATDNLEENVFCGMQIQKRLIPKEYIKKYGITNLWKYNLPKGWRILYSIRREEIIVMAVILEWFDHKEYERRFKY